MPSLRPFEITGALFVLLASVGPRRSPGRDKSMRQALREFDECITGRDDAPFEPLPDAAAEPVDAVPGAPSDPSRSGDDERGEDGSEPPALSAAQTTAAGRVANRQASQAFLW